MSQRNDDPGSNSLPVSGTHQFALLADGPLHEKSTETAWCWSAGRGAILLLEIGNRMMGDAATFDRGRSNLNRPHPARFGQAGLRHAMIPCVLGYRGHREGL